MGAWFADVLLLLFGFLAYLVPVMIIYTGVLIYRERKINGEFDGLIFSIRFSGFVLTLLAGTALASIHFFISRVSCQSRPLAVFWARWWHWRC